LQVVEKATAARDVPSGQSWAFADHRTMAKVIAAERRLRRRSRLIESGGTTIMLTDAQRDGAQLER
jgi:hypothetical protein